MKEKWPIRTLSNQKGMTLVELLVALAILTAVAIPFWSIFLSSTQNNVISQETLKASALAQQAMTQLRAKSAAELAGDTGGLFYKDDTLTATYTVESLPAGGMAAAGDFTAPTSYALTFTLGPSSVQVSGSAGAVGDYSLTDGFYLEITGTESPYAYTLYKEDKATVLSSGSLLGSSGMVNMAINLTADRIPTDPQLTLHVNLAPTIPAAAIFNFYIADKGDAVVLFNDGINPFYQYYNLSRNAGSSHRVLYKISVDVSQTRRNELLSRLVSYELK